MIKEGDLKKYQIIHNPCNAENSWYTMKNIDGFLSVRPSFYAIVWNNGLWDDDSWINTPANEYIRNEMAIAEAIKAKTKRPMFATTTGVPKNTPYRSDAGVAYFNTLAKATMTAEGVPMVDLYTASHKAPIVNEHVDSVAQDDVHYTPQGYDDLSHIVLNALKNKYGIK
jgi:lysophospholipase L1-like esterase